MNRFFRSVGLAAALTLALVVPTFAASSSTVQETLTVSSYLSIAGVPPTVAYQATVAGGWAYADSLIDVTVATNETAGVRVMVTATALTGSNGTIPAINRYFGAKDKDGFSGAGTTVIASGFGSTLGTAWAGGGAYPGAQFELARTTAAGEETIVVGLKLDVPANLPAGAYTGSTTFSAVGN